jgi:zinc D-Ala-D-Ala carboxypeptidase
MINWKHYPNFSKAEFDCKETGENKMQPVYMQMIQALRADYGKPMRVTSGYRSPNHSIEARKSTTSGLHPRGLAGDYACDVNTCYEIVALAIKHGFNHIGISQRNGAPRFVHLGYNPDLAKPVMYGY